jgi:Anticodon binding domain
VILSEGQASCHHLLWRPATAGAGLHHIGESIGTGRIPQCARHPQREINYNIREHSVAKVPVILVCGKRETEEGRVNIRRLGQAEQQSVALAEALATLTKEAIPTDKRRLTVQ